VPFADRPQLWSACDDRRFFALSVCSLVPHGIPLFFGLALPFLSDDVTPDFPLTLLHFSLYVFRSWNLPSLNNTEELFCAGLLQGLEPLFFPFSS